jgi:hypothetical protein
MSEQTSHVLVFVFTETVLLFLLSVCEYMLIADRLRRYAKDYTALRNCGMSKNGFCCVQSIQILIIVFVNMLTAVPLAQILVNAIVDRYKSRISALSWIGKLDGLAELPACLKRQLICQ